MRYFLFIGIYLFEIVINFEAKTEQKMSYPPHFVGKFFGLEYSWSSSRENGRNVVVGGAYMPLLAGIRVKNK